MYLGLRDTIIKTLLIPINQIEKHMNQKFTFRALLTFLICAVMFTSTKAQTVLLSEDFASITSGDNTTTGGSSVAWAGNTNFPTKVSAYNAGGAVRIGSSSAVGSITSKTLDLSGNGGSFTIQFDVKGWTTIEGTSIIVTVTGLTAQTVSYTATASTSFESKTLNFTGGTANSTVTIATTSKRAYLDNIIVSNAAAVTTPTITSSLSSATVSSVAGTASAAQSYNLSAVNLTGFPGNILVTPSTGLEVSLSSTSGFASTLNVPYTTATLSAVPVFFRSSTSATQANFPATLTNSGGGASANAVVNVTGTITSTEPTSQASAVITSAIGDSTITINWTNGDGGSRIVVVRPTISAAVAPTDGVAYTANTALPSAGTTGTGNYVVYSGTGSSVIVTKLSPSTNYTITVYEYNGATTTINYLTSAATGNPATATTTGPVVVTPIAAWDFTGVGTTSIPSFAATTFNSNLVKAPGDSLTRGAGASWSAAGNSFRTIGFKNNGIGSLVNDSTDYFQVTLTPKANATMSLSTIDAKLAGTGTFAPTTGAGVSSQFAFSLNGTSFTLIDVPQVTNGTPVALTQINLSGIAALQNIAAGTSVTFRYYASGQTTTGGWGFYSAAAGTNGLAIGGTVTLLSTTPLSLEYVKGQKSSNGNAINWKVNCQSTKVALEVERAGDARNFKSINRIEASQLRCKQAFDYTDAAPLAGKNYYRIKMIDVDGKIAYSPVVLIINGSKGLEVVGLYPSSVSNQTALSVSTAKATSLQATITDMSGKVMKTFTQNLGAGSNLINIDCSQLKAGIYNLSTVGEGAFFNTTRFIKL